MTRATFAFALGLAVAAVAAGCHPATRPPPATAAEPPAAAVASGEAGASPGKPQAPVTIDATVAEGSARVMLRFDADASGVNVRTWGVDGLTVTSQAHPVRNARYAAGTSATLPVSFTAGAGRSFLAVSIEGEFGSGPRAKVVAFPIGEPTAEQEKTGGSTIITGPGGERIKVMP